MECERPLSRALILTLAVVATAASTLRAQTVIRVDVGNDGSQSPSGATSVDVSADGTRVVFASASDGLDPTDANGKSDVLLRDLVAGTTTLISVSTSGAHGNDASDAPRISADGRFVAFDSKAKNLVASDKNGVQDVFLRDLAAGVTTRVSVASDGSEANGASTVVAISADGQRVLFASDATNLVTGDGNRTTDLFLRDVAAGTTIRVSTAADGSEANDFTSAGDLSPDGNVVAMLSWATNLVANDTNGWSDVFVRDLTAGTLVRASVDGNGDELEYGAGNFYDPGDPGGVLSGDGRIVAFSSYEPDIVQNDGNDSWDVFVRDLDAGTTTIASVDSSGNVSATYFVGSVPRGVSSDARFVLFEGDALALAPNENSNILWDVFVRDRELAMTTRQSDDANGFAGNGTSFGCRMTPDGRNVVFLSAATDLVSDDTNSSDDAFLVTRPLRDASWDNYGVGLAGTHGVPSLTATAAPRLNERFGLALGNSLGSWTVALLLVGTESAQIPTRLGGDLLVLPLWSLLVAVAPGGSELDQVLPPDERLASISLFVQALELDPGAAHGVSFTAGLELRPGF